MKMNSEETAKLVIRAQKLAVAQGAAAWLRETGLNPTGFREVAIILAQRGRVAQDPVSVVSASLQLGHHLGRLLDTGNSQAAITFGCTPEQKERLEGMARAEGLALGEYLLRWGLLDP